jgi:creatinine amidohydrolase
MKNKITNYIEYYPDILLKEISINPVGYLPLGAMEWHSYHLPLGFDGMACEYFFRRLAKLKGGVVFPTLHYGIAENMPHPASFTLPDKNYKAFVRNIIKGIISLGIKVVIVGTGHWSANQIMCLLDLSAEFNKKYENKRVLVSGLPLGITGYEKGLIIDHAGVYETSFGIELFPDKVRLERLGNAYLENWNFPDAEQLAYFGIECRRDPRKHSSKEEGHKIFSILISDYINLIDEMFAGKTGLLEKYSRMASDFLKSNFSELYGNTDPLKFYKKVKKILIKKYYGKNNQLTT